MTTTPRRAAVLPTLLVALLGLLVALPVTTATSTPARAVPTRAERAHVSLAGGQVHTVRLAQPAGHVAAYWAGRPAARVELSFSSDGVRFGPWVGAGHDEAGRTEETTTYGALHDAGDAVAVRLRADRRLGRVTVVGLSDVTTPAPSRERAVPAAAHAATTQPAIVSRAGWGADESLMTWAPEFHDTRKLVVHHTATGNAYADAAAAAEAVRAIYRYHAVERDWGDIGYNFLIDRFGTIYEGRWSRDYQGATPSGDDASGRGVTGAHTVGWNSGSLGVAMLGTYSDADVSPAARDALRRLLAWAAARNGIDPEATEPFVNPVSGSSVTTPNIAGHRDYAATECPGATFHATLPRLRRDVAAEIAGTPSDTTAPGAPSGLRADGDRARVELAWSAAVDDTGVTSYVVQRRRGDAAWTRLSEVTTTAYVDTAVARRTRYTYRVRAVDAAGNAGPWSATATTRTT